MSFFSERVSVRLTTEARKKAKALARYNQDVFENEGHFYRAAVAYFIRACLARGLVTRRVKKQKSINITAPTNLIKSND